MKDLRTRIIRLALISSVCLVLGALGIAATTLYFLIFFDLPDIASIDDFKPALSSMVLDRNAQPIGEFFEERRKLAPIEEIPEHVISAFVAGEDAAFFEHEGIDYISIVRAALKNVHSKIDPGGSGGLQGGSTITQQVAKSFLSPERTYRRKLRDMVLARRLEENLTKQEILFIYLNQIYFGRGAYGISEAARQYFDKRVQDLSVSEAALLAGLPKAPSRYSPYVNPERAESRRAYVLGEMRSNNFIDETIYQEALAELPELNPPSELEDYPYAAYFTEEVRRYLLEIIGNDAILHGGLVIETTLDLELQKQAVEAIQRGLVDLDHRQGYEGPLRTIPEAAIGEELLALATKNRLERSTSEELSEAGAAAPQAVPLEELLPLEQSFLGVITQVDASAKMAVVSFAPDISGIVLLEDVAWARPRDKTVRPNPVTKIEKIFKVGDLASFQRVVPDVEEEKTEELVETDLLRFTIQQEPKVEGALLSLDVASGDVLAMVGGYGFERSQFNRVTQARRQPGSAFKPIVYAAAVSQGFTAASILVDRPYIYKNDETGHVWRPKGYSGKFLGRMTLREALARSVNNVAIHLLKDVGIDHAIDYARILGIESPLQRDMALALGSSDLSLLELTRAYTVFPSGGKLNQPRFVTRVKDREGNVLIENLILGEEPKPLITSEEDSETEEETVEELSPEASLEKVVRRLEKEGEEEIVRVIPEGHVIHPTDAFLMTDLLRAVVSEGTGRRARVLGQYFGGKPVVGGKTGTTNDQADAWFMGFSSNITTGVWVGFDEKNFLGKGETGSRAALPIWIDFMKVALENHPPENFVIPDDIVFVRIDRETGLLASKQSEKTLVVPFLDGTEPSETATLDQQTDPNDALRHELF